MYDCGIDGLTFKKPSLCKPQFASDCDLHTIVDRFMRTGQLPESSRRQPLEGDFTQVEDFQAIQDRCVSLRQQFEMMPLEVRNKFNNDPVAWASSVLDNNPNSEPQPDPTEPTEPKLESEVKTED